MQTVGIWVPPLFFSGFFGDLIGFENSIWNPFVQEHIQLFWCTWYWRRVLVFLSFQLPFLLARWTLSWPTVWIFVPWVCQSLAWMIKQSSRPFVIAVQIVKFPKFLGQLYIPWSYCPCTFPPAFSLHSGYSNQRLCPWTFWCTLSGLHHFFS